MSESFLNGKVELHCGDLLAVLPTLAENSIDACVCDPPYHLTSIVKRFGNEEPKKWEAVNNNHGGGNSPYHRTSKGFMGQKWDGGDVAFQVETWAEVYRVLKPGAFLLAMGGDRTYHRLAVAIEDAGFEVRGTLAYIFGSGFPKSRDITKDLLSSPACSGLAADAVGFEVSGTGLASEGGHASDDSTNFRCLKCGGVIIENVPDGLGTALKPAMELVCLARKPLSENTVAANVLRWGTGAINVDGCRVGVREKPKVTDPKHNGHEHNTYGAPSGGGKLLPDARWPANLIHDGSEEVLAGFPESDGQQGDLRGTEPSECFNGVYSGPKGRHVFEKRGDTGSAARFFYTAKADSDDRLGSKHPTVKPLDLMQYLVRLVTPRGGTVLDCFAGTGTTGEAAFREGFRAVLIEREAEYQIDIRRRMKLAMSGPDERARESIKERMKDKPVDHGPLFGDLGVKGITYA